MNLLGVLENGLFALSQVLRLPVIGLLWVCVGSALFMAGGVVLEFVARRRERRGFDLKAWMDAGAALDADSQRVDELPAALRSLLRDVRAESGRASFSDGGLEHAVRDREHQVHRTLCYKHRENKRG